MGLSGEENEGQKLDCTARNRKRVSSCETFWWQQKVVYQEREKKKRNMLESIFLPRSRLIQILATAQWPVPKIINITSQQVGFSQKWKQVPIQDRKKSSLVFS